MYTFALFCKKKSKKIRTIALEKSRLEVENSLNYAVEVMPILTVYRP